MIWSDAGMKKVIELSQRNCTEFLIFFFLIEKLVNFLLFTPQNLLFIKDKGKGKEKVMCSSRLQNTVALSQSALTKTNSVH